MKENFAELYEKDGHSMVVWALMYHVKKNDHGSDKLNKYRVIAWQSLNKVEKGQVVNSWKKADVQQMENEQGPVGTVAVMFETRQNELDGFIVVYIDQKTYKITGTETFY